MASTQISYLQLLKDRNEESDMQVLGDIPVPDKPRVLYGLLPEHHGRRHLQHLQDHTSLDLDEIQIQIDAQEVALMLAAITCESWFRGLEEAIMKTATAHDPSAAEQTMKLGYLWWFRAKEFGAGPREGILAARNTYEMHTCKGKVWSGELKHILCVPRLDVLLSYEPSSNTDEAWLPPRSLKKKCWVNPIAAEVGAIPPLLLTSPVEFPQLLGTASHVITRSDHQIQGTEQAVNSQAVAHATADVNKGPDRAARPADPGPSKKQKPGKAQRQRAREAAAAAASASVTSEQLLIPDTQPYGEQFTALDLQLSGPRTSSPSLTGNGTTSSSSSGGASSSSTS